MEPGCPWPCLGGDVLRQPHAQVGRPLTLSRGRNLWVATSQESEVRFMGECRDLNEALSFWREILVKVDTSV